MSYVNRSRGLGFAPGYQLLGYCPGGNIPNYMQFPDGSLHCLTDAEIGQLETIPVNVPPANYIPNQAPGYTPTPNPNYNPNPTPMVNPSVIGPSGSPVPSTVLPPAASQSLPVPSAQIPTGGTISYIPTPSAPVSAPQAPASSAPAAGSSPGSGAPGTAQGAVDSAMSWISANPLLAAGIAAGAFFLLSGRRG